MLLDLLPSGDIANLVLRVLIFPGFLFIFILTLFCQWVARKIQARMQNRVGPMVAGPWGILQPWADFVKLIAKENSTRKIPVKLSSK